MTRSRILLLLAAVPLAPAIVLTVLAFRPSSLTPLVLLTSFVPYAGLLDLVALVLATAAVVLARAPRQRRTPFLVAVALVAPLLALLAIGVAAAIQYGYIVIMVIIVAYVLHIPFAVRSKRWLAAHPEAWSEQPRERRAARRAIRRARRPHPHRRSMARLGLRKPPRS